jgi:hypothetical protein
MDTFSLTGIEVEEDDITSQFLHTEDANKLFHQLNRHKESMQIKLKERSLQEAMQGGGEIETGQCQNIGWATTNWA